MDNIAFFIPIILSICSTLFLVKLAHARDLDIKELLLCDFLITATLIGYYPNAVLFVVIPKSIIYLILLVWLISFMAEVASINGR